MGTNAERCRRWYKEVWKPGGESTVLELMAEKNHPIVFPPDRVSLL